MSRNDDPRETHLPNRGQYVVSTALIPNAASVPPPPPPAALPVQPDEDVYLTAAKALFARHPSVAHLIPKYAADQDYRAMVDAARAPLLAEIQRADVARFATRDINARLVDEVVALRAGTEAATTRELAAADRANRALSLLIRMVDDDPCRGDVGGDCHTHGWDKPCANAQALLLIAEVGRD